MDLTLPGASPSNTAMGEIPEDLTIPSRLVLTREAMAEIADRSAEEDQPTDALKALFRGGRKTGCG